RPYLGKIKLLRRRNGGVATALNAGMREARGRYLAICDADDVQLSHRFAAHAAVLDQEPEVAQVFSDMQTWQDGEITVESTLRDRPMGPFETSFDHALEQAFGSAHSTARARNLPVLEEHAE